MKKESLVLLLCLIVEYALAETLQLFSATTFIDTPSVILTGSLRGGRTVYIEGVGFPNDPNQIQVWIGPYPCLIPADGSTPIAIGAARGASPDRCLGFLIVCSLFTFYSPKSSTDFTLALQAMWKVE